MIRRQIVDRGDSDKAWTDQRSHRPLSDAMGRHCGTLATATTDATSSTMTQLVNVLAASINEGCAENPILPTLMSVALTTKVNSTPGSMPPDRAGHTGPLRMQKQPQPTETSQGLDFQSAYIRAVDGGVDANGTPLPSKYMPCRAKTVTAILHKIVGSLRHDVSQRMAAGVVSLCFAKAKDQTANPEVYFGMGTQPNGKALLGLLPSVANQMSRKIHRGPASRVQ